MEDKYVCPCGLTCCDCLFYNRQFFDAAKTMKRLIEHYGFDIFFSMLSKSEASAHIARHLNRDVIQFAAMFRVLEHMPEFLKVLEGIIAIQCQSTCREKNGCSIGGATHQCEALACVNRKEIEGCWKCAEYTICDKLAFQRRSYGKTVTENLAQLEREGSASLQSRGNRYYEWQRKMIKADETA